MSSSFSSAAAAAIPLIIILFFHQQIPATRGDFSFPETRCDLIEKFTPDGTYQANLAALKFELAREVRKNKGFATYQIGKGNDTVYGLAQCRGDLLNNETCFSCVAKASVDTEKTCHNSKSAFIWYDWCSVKYAPRNFFGKLDIINKLGLTNTVALTENPDFVDTVDVFLRGLVKTASGKRTLFAEGKMKSCGFLTLYGFVQCSQDVNVNVCLRCLNYAVSSLSYVSAGKQGGRTYLGSCQARYEIYVIPTS